MEILIIGAGLVGAALGEYAGSRAVVTRSSDADLRNEEQVRALIARHRPRWVVLSAAVSNVDLCERDPELAFDVNARGAERVARAVRDAGARLLFISTDYVFDGTATTPYEIDAPRRPIAVYARSKAAGEDAVLATLPDAIVARTSWVFGTHRNCFATWVLAEGATHDELSVVADKTTCPTYNRDLAAMLLGLIDRGASGVFHTCNAGPATWLSLATTLLGEAGLTQVRLKPISMKDMRWDAPRPPYSVLSVASLERIGIRPRPWQEAVRDFVVEMRQQGRLPAPPPPTEPAGR